MSIRAVKNLSHPKPTLEGAGVRLQRAFGFGNTRDHDPFLLFDDFRNDNPDDYLAGFPWHPHRGIETITYVLAGDVEHGDSLGNRGSLGAGDVQWMTAGSGILHQEMPKGDAQGRMHGFQLWSNLPASLKMTKPRYQDVLAKDIPEVTDDDGTTARIVVGDFWGKTGPVVGVAAEPRYVDISVPPGTEKRIAIERSHHAFAYVFAGSGTFRDSSAPQSVLNELTGVREQGAAGNRSLVLFDQGDEIVVRAGDEGIRFLLVSGKPLEEPVAWYGPIVMNTPQELRLAQYRAEQRHVHQRRRRRLLALGDGPRGHQCAGAVVGRAAHRRRCRAARARHAGGGVCAVRLAGRFPAAHVGRPDVLHRRRGRAGRARLPWRRDALVDRRFPPTARSRSSCSRCR